MTPMEELREQAAKIADNIEWLENFGLSLNCTVAENDRIRRIVKFARALPAPVALPAGEVDAATMRVIYNTATAPCRTREDMLTALSLIAGYARKVIDRPTPTETPTAAAPDDGLMGRYRAALRDIAGAEPIPTDREAFQFCRDVARAALSTATGDEGGKV